MQSSVMWLASFKIKALDGCDSDYTPNQIYSGEVGAYGETEIHFKETLTNIFNQKKMKLIEYSHLTKLDDAKWVTSHEHNESIMDLIDNVIFTQEMHFNDLRQIDLSEV